MQDSPVETSQLAEVIKHLQGHCDFNQFWLMLTSLQATAAVELTVFLFQPAKPNGHPLRGLLLFIHKVIV